MGSHWPFGHLNHKLWPKEGPKIKLAIWLSTIKSRESTRFLHVQCDIPLKSFQRGLQILLQTSSQLEVCTQNYGARKSRESQPWRFRDSHLGVARQKTIWMWASWRGAEYTIRGEGGGFPQVRAVVSLMCPCCLWLVLAPKVLQLCTNHLALVLCKSVWVSEACQLFLVPFRSSSTPFYPSKMLRTKECAPTFYSSALV